MSAFKILALAAAVALPLAACNAPGPTKPSAVDRAGVAAAVIAVDAAGVADWKTRDPAKVAAHYTADALLMEPFSDPTTGTAAIQAAAARSFADPGFSLTYTPTGATVSEGADMVVTSGRFDYAATDPASKTVVHQTGAYVTVWKKQADGGWKAAIDIATPGAPPAAPAK